MHGVRVWRYAPSLGGPCTCPALPCPAHHQHQLCAHTAPVLKHAHLQCAPLKSLHKAACGSPHPLTHTLQLRAFVLGANDGLVSVASLMMGVAGGVDDLATMRLAGIAAWIAGALSMVRRPCTALHACMHVCMRFGSRTDG